MCCFDISLFPFSLSFICSVSEFLAASKAVTITAKSSGVIIAMKVDIWRGIVPTQRCVFDFVCFFNFIIRFKVRC